MADQNIILTAIDQGKPELIPDLVKSGVPLESAALRHAAARGDEKSVRAVLKAAKEHFGDNEADYLAFVNASGKDSATALHIISRSHLSNFQGKNVVKDVMVALAEGGADFRLVDGNNSTALRHLSQDPGQHEKDPHHNAIMRNELPQKYYDTLKSLETAISSNLANKSEDGKLTPRELTALSSLATLKPEIENYAEKVNIAEGKGKGHDIPEIPEEGFTPTNTKKAATKITSDAKLGM